MSKQLRISAELALPTSAVTSTLVVLGGKGMGKTNLSAVLIEEMAKAGLRWRHLDPIGVSWGLRHSKDGKGKGVECLILGGVHGDIAIEPTAGDVVADFLVDEGVNVIVDFSRRASGEMWTVGEKIRFLTALTLRVFQRQGSLVDGRRREPFFLSLDEAARYIPQNMRAGDAEIAKCLGAWEQIVEEGRNIGIGVGLLTQRSARINKSVTELADVLFAFRVVGPKSLEAITDWLGDHVPREQVKENVRQIRELDVGSCLAISPGWMKYEGVIHIRERETFDSSATPKPGERQKKVSGAAAAPDLGKYLDRMKATIDKAKAADPRELQKEIVRLKGELGKIQKSALTRIGSLASIAAAPDPAALQRRIDRAVTAAVKDERQRIDRERRSFRQAALKIGNNVSAAVGQLQSQTSRLTDLSGELARFAGGIRVEAPAVAAPEQKSIDYQPRGERLVTVPPPRLPRIASPTALAETNGDLTAGEHRILNAVAELKALGTHPASRAQAGIVAGYNLSGGTPARYVGALVERALLEIPTQGQLALTPTGEAATATVSPPASLEELHARVFSRLTDGEAKILRHLVSIYPEAQSRAQVGDAVGYNLSGGTPARYVGKLVTLDFATIPRQGELRASDFLFPEALS